MRLPDRYKYDTLEELLDCRTKILARPFPQGYSGEERQMMDWLEKHCTNNFMKALEALKEEHARCMKAYDKLGEIHPDHYEIISMIEKMEKV